MKRLKPFFTFFGAKHRSAPKYDAPEFSTIVEPFAGSAGYSTLHYDRNVVLMDADEIIAGTWQYLIHVSADEIRSLPLIGEGWESTDDLTSLPQESRWIIGWWLNKGTTHPGKKPSAWARSGLYTRQFWGPEIRERVASQVDAIRHWRVLYNTYETAPDYSATWFIDPPYEVAGTRYRKSARNIDYDALGVFCRTRSGQVVVCENDGAEWLPFEPFASTKAMHGGARTGVSREVVWRNTDAQEDTA